jgi:SAM-dependent methyltransferase
MKSKPVAHLLSDLGIAKCSLNKISDCLILIENFRFSQEVIKLNVGASPLWSKDGWRALDHKLKKSTADTIAGDASSIDLTDGSCVEHIPHIRLPVVLSEINRVLKPGGVFAF